MGMSCGKYLVVMLNLWPALLSDEDMGWPFATEQSLAELRSISAAMIDRYLVPARKRMEIKGHRNHPAHRKRCHNGTFTSGGTPITTWTCILIHELACLTSPDRHCSRSRGCCPTVPLGA